MGDCDMKYVTMTKITEEERADYLKVLHEVYDTSPAGCPKYETLKRLYAWLENGTTRAVTRRGNAADLLEKFIGGQGSATFIQHVHEANGTQIACNGFCAAVILPAHSEAWALGDAYFEQDNGERWTVVQDSLYSAPQKSKTSAVVATLQELLAAVTAQREAHRRSLIEARKKPSDYPPPPVALNALTMEALTAEQAADMYSRAEGLPMAFNSAYLELSLKFILCAGEDIEVYHDREFNPLYMRAQNLYILLLPMRVPKWERNSVSFA